MKKIINIEFYQRLLPPLVGALLGGVLSLAGSYLATRWNYNNQMYIKKQEKREKIRFDLNAIRNEIESNYIVDGANQEIIDGNKSACQNLMNRLTDSTNITRKPFAFNAVEKDRIGNFPIPSEDDTVLITIYADIKSYYDEVNYYNEYLERYDIWKIWRQ